MFRFVALILVTAISGFAAPNGAALYRQYCAECHGKNGEGAKGKGKYEEPLHGDKSLDRLARYIDKNMPDDDPDKLDAAQSRLVAEYIYHAFYSDEARLKKNPPRIELAHLTNRQYINTVSDLLGRFLNANWTLPAADSERGLRGSYYDSRNFNQNKKLYERVDPQIQFDFANAGPEKTTTNEYSISWRGSVIADDTGFYEFIVKTPNGARLWINDEQDPLIDAWVSNPENTEHRGTLRLIGGRAYPLRLETFRFKDKTNSIALLWKPPHAAEQAISPQNLSPARANAAFIPRTQFPADDSSAGYERGVGVSKEWDEATIHAALETAAYVVKNLDRLSNSKAAETNRVAKLQSFAEQFVTAAFRHPLTSDDKKLYIEHHFKTAPKPEEAIKRIVLFALQSPRFLYPNLSAKTHDDYDVATQLSYTLWDSAPDADLLKAAESGKLKSDSEIRAQAARMLKDPRAHAKLRYFFTKWLDTERADDIAKDSKLYSDFTPEVAADLRTSLYLFLDEVVWSQSSDYRQLLLADYLYANQRLARFYDLQLPSANPGAFAKVPLDPAEHAGVITHPFILSALAYSKQSSPIHRGVFLTRKIVGRTLRPPPMAVAFNDAEFDPTLTMREKITQLTKPNNCQGCHSVINPLGFTLENFDAVGRFRTIDNNKPINAAGEYKTPDGDTIKLATPRDLATYAATNPDAQKQFIQQLFQQFVKQPLPAYGPNKLTDLQQTFRDNNCNIQKLLIEIAITAAKVGPAVPSGPPTARKSSD